MSNSPGVRRMTTPKNMRGQNAGNRGVAMVNRLGFIHGMTGETRLDEREVFAWVVSGLGLPPRETDARNLQACGEAYSVGRLMGAEMYRDYVEMTPERRERLANTLWPASTILPRAMEARLDSTLSSFRPQPRDPALDDVPVDGAGPVAQWW